MNLSLECNTSYIQRGTLKNERECYKKQRGFSGSGWNWGPPVHLTIRSHTIPHKVHYLWLLLLICALTTRIQGQPCSDYPTNATCKTGL